MFVRQQQQASVTCAARKMISTVRLRLLVLPLYAGAFWAPQVSVAQRQESPADRCSWEGWLPPDSGRARVRGAAHLSPQSIADLQSRAAGADKNARILAAQSLGAAQDGASMLVLMRLTGDLSPQVQDAAARALGRAGYSTAVPALIALASSRDSHVRQGAIWALGQLQDPRAVGALVSASADTSKHIRAEATWALGLVGGRRAIERLIALGPDANPHVRLAAACSLERVHDPRTIGALSALSRDTDPLVREVGEWALHRIARTQRLAPATM
jgi:HEAT repeat protein